MSIYRRKDKSGQETSKVYYYDFVRHGRRFSGCTGETSKRKAALVEARIRANASMPRDETSIDGAFKIFWEEKGQYYEGEDTVWWRLSALQDNLEEILADENLPTNLQEIRTRHLVQYAERRRHQPTRRNKLPSASTINREIQLLRTIMRYAVNVWEKPLHLPSFAAALGEEPEGVVAETTLDEQAAIKRHLRDDYHDVLDFLILAGVRAGNAIMRKSRVLTADMVDLENREITIWLKSKKPGGRRLVLPITDPMLVILANNLGRHPDAVFTYVAKATRDGRIRGQRYPISYSAFYTAFKAAAKSIGRPGLRVHDLRHTALTRIYRATGDIRLAQMQAGHTRVTTTTRYSHVAKSDLRAGMDAAHNSHKIPTEPAGQPDKALIKKIK